MIVPKFSRLTLLGCLLLFHSTVRAYQGDVDSGIISLAHGRPAVTPVQTVTWAHLMEPPPLPIPAAPRLRIIQPRLIALDSPAQP